MNALSPSTDKLSFPMGSLGIMEGILQVLVFYYTLRRLTVVSRCLATSATSPELLVLPSIAAFGLLSR